MALRLQIVTASTTPIYRQIVEQVRAAIARGTLATGEPLPSVRALAEELVVNMNTVAKAYGELVRSGDVVSEPGRGVFVTGRPHAVPAAERRRKLALAMDRLIAEAVHLGLSRRELVAALAEHCERVGLPPDGPTERRHA
ncbi:MAG: GntR family transcriptional regulator [Polyangiaceae bacterium]